MQGSQPDLHPANTPPPTPTRSAPWRARRRALWQVLGGFVLLGAMLAQCGWWGLSARATNDEGARFNHGQNATWVAHAWVGETHSDAEYDTLAERLKHEQITYIYAHVGPLTGSGTIPVDRFSNAFTFAAALHSRLPELRILAWIGQIYRVGADPSEDIIDLARSQTRDNITETAELFTSKLGFDGIHYDIEPVPNNDNHFLDLLDATRQRIGAGKVLSLSTPNWIPVARVTDVLQTLRNQQNVWWTTYYYGTVSKHVDQIVAMMYNTGMPTAPLYELVVQQETAHILRTTATASPTTHVIIAIPTYTAPASRAFHASAENMRTGLRAVIGGLNEDEGLSAFMGVAVYPEWLTSDADWAIYDHQWLGN
ncbi:MAG: hypothetical protein H0X24_04365 [Ktedonobacterales bacterium]|nr:hypothetical protein [Ktedonobacterales bacterium]